MALSVTQSDNGKLVTLTGLITTETPTKIEISKGYDSTNYIQIPYSGSSTYVLSNSVSEIISYFDGLGIWIDDIYELKITYPSTTLNTNFLADFNSKKKVYTIIGKIPYDVKFGYQFDKNVEYGAYAEILYKSLKVAESKLLWERATYILKAISKLNINYIYR